MQTIYKKANILYIPSLLLLIVFVFYPFIDGFRIAFTNWNGYSQSYRYIGLLNFRRLFTNENVLIALKNTMLYGFGSMLLQQLFGFGAALLLNEQFKGRGAARTVIYLPCMISGLIMGYIWRYLTDYSGALNDVLALFGKEPALWLSSPSITVPLLIVINSLQYYGISMLIYLAGLQAIPQMYYEAAFLEGAGDTVVFFKITVPLLYPSFMTSVMLNLIGGLKMFDVIRALTGGGPGYLTHSLSTLIYNTYFAAQNAGFAAAIGFLLFIIILIITVVVERIFKMYEVEY